MSTAEGGAEGAGSQDVSPEAGESAPQAGSGGPDGGSRPSAPDALWPERSEEHAAYINSQGAVLPDSAASGDGGGGEKSEGEASEGEKGDEGSEEVEVGADGRARNKATGQFVPHAALHQERERRKAAEAAAGETQSKIARLEAEIAALKSAAKPEEQADPKDLPIEDQPDIDPEEDVFGALKQTQARLARAEKARAAEAEQQKERDEQETTERAARDYFAQDAAEFSKETPDFGAAFEHLTSVRSRQLVATGAAASEAEAASMVREEARRLVLSAKDRKQSASALLYGLARDFGYQPAEAKREPSEADQQLDRLAQARERAGSLSDGGGGGAAHGADLATIAKMSEAEYAAWREKNPEKAGQLLGGALR